MKELESTKRDVDQDKDGEDVPKLESAEVVLVHCGLVNNNYQQASKHNSKDPNKIMALANVIIYYTWKNIKSAYNNKFKISAPTWNDEFKLPDG